MTDDQVAELCNRLQAAGSAVTTANGKTLAFIASSILAMDRAGPMVLVAWEGNGAFFWNVGDIINTFQLIEAGFSLRVAPTLADILNRLNDCLPQSDAGGGLVRGTSLPQLEGPKGQSRGDDQ